MVGGSFDDPDKWQAHRPLSGILTQTLHFDPRSRVIFMVSPEDTLQNLRLPVLCDLLFSQFAVAHCAADWVSVRR